MVEWHRPNLDPQDIAKIIRDGREENDKKFENYAEYVDYIASDNERILDKYDHDHSKCEPNKLTKEAMTKAIKESMDDVFVSSVDGSESTLMEVLEALGSDYDEDGVPYWDKYKEEQIEGRDNV